MRRNASFRRSSLASDVNTRRTSVGNSPSSVYDVGCAAAHRDKPDLIVKGSTCLLEQTKRQSRHTQSGYVYNTYTRGDPFRNTLANFRPQDLNLKLWRESYTERKE